MQSFPNQFLLFLGLPRDALQVPERLRDKLSHIRSFERDCVTYLSLLVIQCQRKTGNGQEQGSFLNSQEKKKRHILQCEDLFKLALKLKKIYIKDV